jgi:peptidoglycan/LPS O-acetylase OafA/YrhL
VFTIPTAIVLLACVLDQDWWLPQVVNRRMLRWFGKISYGLYVWHWPLYLALGWTLGLPAAIAVAALSYRYVEQPFLRRKRWPAEVRSSEHSASGKVEPAVVSA